MILALAFTPSCLQTAPGVARSNAPSFVRIRRIFEKYDDVEVRKLRRFGVFHRRTTVGMEKMREIAFFLIFII